MSCCTGDLARDYASQSDQARELQQREEIKRSGKSLNDGRMQYILSVPAIHCAQCIFNIEDTLRNIEGIEQGRVNLTLKRVSFIADNAERDPLIVVSALNNLGYSALTLDEESVTGRDSETRYLLGCLAVAGCAAGNIMLLSVSVWTGADEASRDFFHLVSALLAIPAIAYAGQPFFRSALRALRAGRTNMDVPISIGVILTLGMSIYESLRGGEHAYFDAAVTLLFFLLIGRTLDNIMRARARHGVARLARLVARGGLVVQTDGTLNYVPIDEIVPGMVLRIASGERIPVDAMVLNGKSEVDRSLVTGESKPVLAEPGTKLESGVLNLSGPLDVSVQNTAQKSFIADVMTMMEAAENGRGLYVRIADRTARLYAPVVHLLAFLSFLAWMMITQGNWHQSIMIAVAVLIVTCPCALGLAVPVAHVISAVQLFRQGILLKDGSALERLAEMTHVMFDKTGTLTTGTPHVIACAIPEGEAQAQAKALALQSSHPAARSLAAYLEAAPATSLENITEVPGCGMEATLAGKLMRLGRPSWVREIADDPAAIPAKGRLAFAQHNGPLYITELHEQIRPGAAAVIAQLRQNHIASEILSGDSTQAVAQLAATIGVADFRAEMKPADKLEQIAAASALGQKVLMVGDGLNDAPALARAHVSIAPATASDIGRMAADFVFTRDNLLAVTQAHEISLRTASVVKQNFILAIIYNIFAVPLAMAGLVSPLVAAVAMSSSSIIVVANSLRLYLPSRRLKSPPLAVTQDISHQPGSKLIQKSHA